MSDTTKEVRTDDPPSCHCCGADMVFLRTDERGKDQHRCPNCGATTECT